MGICEMAYLPLGSAAFEWPPCGPASGAVDATVHCADPGLTLPIWIAFVHKTAEDDHRAASPRTTSGSAAH